MPWRLIFVIIIFIFFLVFSVFNLDNRCDINFGFTKIHQAPVFITIFFSFVLGFFLAVPFIIRARKNKGKPLQFPKFNKKNQDKINPIDDPIAGVNPNNFNNVNKNDI